MGDGANDGWENRYMATATTGATILFPDEAFNPEATLLAVSLPRFSTRNLSVFAN